jgi:hypothetical protein
LERNDHTEASLPASAANVTAATAAPLDVADDRAPTNTSINNERERASDIQGRQVAADRMEISGTTYNAVEPALAVVAAGDVLRRDHGEVIIDAGSVVAAAAVATGANNESGSSAAGRTTEGSSTLTAAGQHSVAAAPAMPAQQVRTTDDNAANDDDNDDDDDDEDFDNDGIDTDHYYDPPHQPNHYSIQANSANPRRRKPRQPAPSLSTDPERAFAAICKHALADLSGWNAAAARLDAQALLVLQRSVERSVQDDHSRPCAAAVMRRFASTSQAHTAKARFLRIVAQLQLAAWVRLRLQRGDMRQQSAKAQLTAVLTELLDDKDDQRGRLAWRRDVNAGRLWEALVGAFDFGVVIILPSALGFSNQG